MADHPLGELITLLGKRMGPVPPSQTATLHVVGSPHGIANGWFAHPWNYDPTWLVSCDGFTSREGAQCPEA